MKKITLFASLAIVASSALAIEPARQREIHPQMSVANVLTKQPLLKKVSADMFAQSRADGDVADSTYPTYTCPQAFFIGLARDLNIYTPFIAFGPGRGTIGFNSLVNAESYKWDWTVFLGEDETEDMTSEATNLSFPAVATDEMTFPTLTTTVNGVSSKYGLSFMDSKGVMQNPELIQGGGPATYSNFDDTEGNLLPLAPVSAVGNVMGTMEATINYTDPAQYSSENGTLLGLFEDLFSGSDEVSGKLAGYGAILPGVGTPYLLSAGYIAVSSDAEQAIPVEVIVHALDEEGRITNQIIGKGEAVIPEGEFFDLMSFELESVNEMEYSTGAPVVVPATGAYLSIHGMNVPGLKEFTATYNGGVNVPVSAFQNKDLAAIYDAAYPDHAILEFETVNSKGENSTYFLRTGSWGYGDSKDKTVYHMATDFYIAYDVVFPYIRNFTQGYDANDMTITLKEVTTEEGELGYGNRFFFADDDIMQLVDDEYVTIEQDGDWFEYLVEPDEDQPRIFQIEVAADPLPEGVEGRRGSITISGLAYDYTIYVIQGTVANINEVVAAKAKNGIVYDLQGRVVKNATKGIYIVDGKKVIL